MINARMRTMFKLNYTAGFMPGASARRSLLITAMLFCAACQQQPDPPTQAPIEAPMPWFVEMAGKMGLDFIHRSGHDGNRYLLPESASGGGALFDMDGDGFLDIYLVQSAESSGQTPGNRLYRNDGGNRFVDVTAASGAGDRGYGMGAATADYDGDGDTDLYVTNVGPNVLFRNEGPDANGVVTFTDVSAEAGVDHPGFGTSAAFLDYDNDGDLDLYVVNYIVWSEEIERECSNRLGEPDYCDPTEYDAPAPDTLYRNNGDGSFTDVSRPAGLESAFGNGLGVVTSDFNGDGLPDVFVANDRMPDQLWVNVKGGHLEDQGLMAGCAVDDGGKAKAGMGVDARDIDDDGDADLLVVNFSNESDSLFRNEGSFFTDITAVAGLGTASRPFTRFGLGLVDFDNDGLLDIYQAAGRVARQSPRYNDDPYAEPNLLLAGTRRPKKGFRFEEVEPRGGTAQLNVASSRAAVFGDIDNDGAVDVVVVNRDGPAHLLRNIAGRRNHWIAFRVLNERGADALGARVELRLAERSITREVRSAYSYCAANDPRVHIGLGGVTEVQDVSVQWPDGSREVFGAFSGDQIIALQRGTGTTQ
jgi:hypothetical protein